METNKRSYNEYCAVARALDVIGERWTLLLVRELLTGPKRFKDLLEGLPGIGTNLLTARLKNLEEHELIRRATLPPPAGSNVYELTSLGRQLKPVILDLARWGLRFLGEPRQEDELRPAWAMMAMASTFEPQAAQQGIRETYEFRIDEEGFHARVADGKAELRQGPAVDPDLVVDSDTQSFLALTAGQLEPEEALSTGVIRIEGDHNTLLRCLEMIRPPTNTATGKQTTR